MGAHFLAIKDMAGLCRPFAARKLIKALKDAVGLPIHFHTHDTSGINSASIIQASESGVDVVDLRHLLRPLSGARVQLVAPATPIALPARTAAELVAAVGSALDNVRVHAGPDAMAWVLVEQESGSVTVTVRDDGPGMAPGRVAEAAAAGRLGIAQSITGRVRDLGGEVTITTAAARGVEVEMRVPRPR